MAKINYDDGTIRFTNDWYTAAMLKSMIIDMLNAGNCKITNHARALEELDGAMDGAESIYAVLPARTLNGLKELASKSSVSMGDCVREALTMHLRS